MAEAKILTSFKLDTTKPVDPFEHLPKGPPPVHCPGCGMKLSIDFKMIMGDLKVHRA